jgi:hypothetical protein
MSDASPPEQLTETTLGPGRGPPWWRSFRVSRKAPRLRTSTQPVRSRKAEATAAPSGEGGGVGEGRGLRGLGAAGLEDDDGLARGGGLGGHGLEGADVAEALDVHAHRRDAGVAEGGEGEVGEARSAPGSRP